MTTTLYVKPTLNYREFSGTHLFVGVIASDENEAMDFAIDQANYRQVADVRTMAWGWEISFEKYAA